MLIYIIDHPDLWKSKKLDFTFCKFNYSKDFYHGILHMLDLHIPCWRSIPQGNLCDRLNFINNNCSNQGTLFGYQEMPHNNIGILGLNKPHIIDRGNKQESTYGRNGLAIKRHILLTLRNHNFKIRPKLEIIELFVHELTHTASNDVDWIEEKNGGNHQAPYVPFHRFTKYVARKLNILQDNIYYQNKNNC